METYRHKLLKERTKAIHQLAMHLRAIPGVLDMGVFGSYAHGTFTDTSDLDVYIVYDSELVDLKTLNKQIQRIDWSYFPEIEIDYYYVDGEFSPTQELVTRNRVSFLKEARHDKDNA